MDISILAVITVDWIEFDELFQFFKLNFVFNLNSLSRKLNYHLTASETGSRGERREITTQKRIYL